MRIPTSEGDYVMARPLRLPPPQLLAWPAPRCTPLSVLARWVTSLKDRGLESRSPIQSIPNRRSKSLDALRPPARRSADSATRPSP